jgi:hypothetical protein
MVRPERTMEFSTPSPHSNVPTVPSGRIFLFAAMPATLWLADYRLSLRDEIRQAICGRLTRPREFLFLQHQDPVDRFVEEVKEISEILRAMIGVNA